MARKIRIIHARDFVNAKPDGELNLEESERLLREVLNASDGLVDFDILVDTRDADSKLSATDLWFLADKLVHHPDTFKGRTAILCPMQRFDHASFFALCAERKGIDMQAFISYEDAMQWLMKEAS